MHKKNLLALAAAGALGLSLCAVAAPAQADEDKRRPGLTYTTVYTAVGDYSQTRATGHYEPLHAGLRIWTEGATSTDKVAGYLATDIPLADALDAELHYAVEFGIPAGAQLVVDIDADGTPDGILVGEPSYYGDNWWLTNSSTAAFKSLDPSGANDSGSGSAYFGTLEQWAAAAPEAEVVAVGFSLGSGVYGAGFVDGFTVDGQTLEFSKQEIVVTNRDGVVVPGQNRP